MGQFSSSFMHAGFYIKVNIRKGRNYECFAQFFLGGNKKFANTVFEKLKGSKKVEESNMLLMDLVETVDGLPVNMEMISCTLEELAENSKIITREVFKFYNMKEK